MKMCEGVEVQLHAFLTSASDGEESSALCLGCFTPGDRAPSTYWIGGRVDPRASVNMVAKRKNPAPARNQTLLIA